MSVTLENRLLNGRRSDIQIIVAILDVASRGAGKTKIVYSVNLNFVQAKKYLSFLRDKGLIFEFTFSSGNFKYQTTDKGRAFVKRYKETVYSIL
jgi:predicted transcriptional regulator